MSYTKPGYYRIGDCIGYADAKVIFGYHSTLDEAKRRGPTPEAGQTTVNCNFPHVEEMELIEAYPSSKLGMWDVPGVGYAWGDGKLWHEGASDINVAYALRIKPMTTYFSGCKRVEGFVPPPEKKVVANEEMRGADAKARGAQVGDKVQITHSEGAAEHDQQLYIIMFNEDGAHLGLRRGDAGSVVTRARLTRFVIIERAPKVKESPHKPGVYQVSLDSGSTSWVISPDGEKCSGTRSLDEWEKCNFIPQNGFYHKLWDGGTFKNPKWIREAKHAPKPEPEKSPGTPSVVGLYKVSYTGTRGAYSWWNGSKWMYTSTSAKHAHEKRHEDTMTPQEGRTWAQVEAAVEGTKVPTPAPSAVGMYQVKTTEHPRCFSWWDGKRWGSMDYDKPELAYTGRTMASGWVVTDWQLIDFKEPAAEASKALVAEPKRAGPIARKPVADRRRKLLIL